MNRPRNVRYVGLGTGLFLVIGGCFGPVGLFDLPMDLTSVVSSKAVEVADRIGGQEGFGGELLEGFADHVGPGMGFVTTDDLADPSGVVTVRLQNLSSREATFHLSYFAAHLALDDRQEDVIVPAGGEIVVQIPCSEIVGMGSLEMPGVGACHLADEEEIDNRYAVPMFLGLDYTCGDTITFTLTPDGDDLDGDGDRDELVVLSEGLIMHMEDGGPLGHSHMNGMMHHGFEMMGIGFGGE